MAGKKSILVVEDDGSVRRLTVRMLESLGYRTFQAVDGEEALQMCRAHAQSMDMVLTDMTMPRMDGKKFVIELWKIDSKIKVLLVSGYTINDTIGGKQIGSEVPLIQKPFTRDDLARKVQEVLGGEENAKGSQRDGP